MTEIEIEIVPGPVRAIPLPASFSDTLLINGPCEFCGWSLREGFGLSPASGEGSVVSPGAGATIVTLTSLAGGTYLVNWTVQLIGAAAAADQDNFKLISSSGLSVVSLNAGAAGQYPQGQAEASILLSGSFTIQAIAAGTVGVTYAAQIEIQPISGVVSSGEIQDGNNPLAEIAVSPGNTDARMFFDSGILVRNRINFHPLGGLISGAIYARYARNTG